MRQKGCNKFFCRLQSLYTQHFPCKLPTKNEMNLRNTIQKIPSKIISFQLCFLLFSKQKMSQEFFFLVNEELHVHISASQNFHHGNKMKTEKIRRHKCNNLYCTPSLPPVHISAEHRMCTTEQKVKLILASPRENFFPMVSLKNRKVFQNRQN